MGFEDIFQGVQFSDTTIKTNAQDAGNAGTPAPVVTEGQTVASPATTEQQTAEVKESDNKVVETDKAADKPAPYDQDPKWKKARAAEAALDAILQEHGLLDIEELKAALASGQSLKQVLGARDAKKLLEDSDYLAKVRSHWDAEKTAKTREGESPDARIERLEKENAELQRAHTEFKSTVQTREHAQKVVQNYGSEVERVIGSLESPVPTTEKELLTLFLGVNNPANMIDIEDQTAVRKMARDGIARFQTLVKNIKQSAIDEYAAGKSKLTVDTTKTGSVPVQSGARKPLDPKLSVDQAFDRANAEFLEVLQKGLEAAH
jgi:exonuclease VII small subunit